MEDMEIQQQMFVTHVIVNVNFAMGQLNLTAQNALQDLLCSFWTDKLVKIPVQMDNSDKYLQKLVKIVILGAQNVQEQQQTVLSAKMVIS